MNKIDRIFIVSHTGRRKLKGMRYRYLSKSILSSCKGDREYFEFLNFRGSHFSKSTFKNALFKGCDFWGTTFNKCNFNEAVFQDCVFQGCIFDKCDFTGAKIQFSAIVNTNTDECRELFIEDTSIILKKYPDLVVPEDLSEAIEGLKNNNYLRKTKLFWISDKKANKLNLYLLLKKYSSAQLVDYIQQLTNRAIKRLTTYGSINSELNKFIKNDILFSSRPTQSRGCDAYGLGNKEWGL